MRIGIFSFRAFDRRLARLAAPISSGVRQGEQNMPPPPAGRVRLNTQAGRGLRWGLEISWLFLHIHWECCTKFLSFHFAQRRLQDHFLGGMFAKFRTIFLRIFGNCKNLIVVMDLFIEKLVLKFGRNRSKNNEAMTIVNIWWKTANFIFGPLNPKFSDFSVFENGSCSSRWGKSNGVYPIEIGLMVLDISRGGGRIGPSSPVNVLQKAHQ